MVTRAVMVASFVTAMKSFYSRLTLLIGLISCFEFNVRSVYVGVLPLLSSCIQVAAFTTNQLVIHMLHAQLAKGNEQEKHFELMN